MRKHRAIVAATGFVVMLLGPAAKGDAPGSAISLSPGQTEAQAVQASLQTEPSPPSPAETNTGSVAAYFETWFQRVARAQSEQPAWVAPLVAPPPFLVEQLRYDQYVEHLGNNASVRNFGVNRGLQLIPTGTEEIDIALPNYIERDNRTPGTGFGDWQFALFKQRLASGSPNNGNYVASAWLSATAPVGSSRFTNHVFFLSPNVGGGKGWGNFDIQATFGASIPTSSSHLYGDSLLGNMVLQYRFEKIIWPEVELNWTDWLNGTQRGGKNQLLMTVGAVVGKVALWKRLSVSLGLGYQFPLAPTYRAQPAILPAYSRNWIASLRVPF